MSLPSTISFADLYGPQAPSHQGKSDPPDTEKASGNTGAVASNRPVIFWIAMVGMLMVARMLWEKGS